MLRTSALAAAFTIVAAAALAADDVLLLPNGTGEALAVMVPQGWAVVGDPADAPDQPVVIAPAGAAADAADRIEVARLPPGGDGAEAVIDGIEADWRARCDAVQYGNRLPFLTDGFSGIVTTIGCTRWLARPEVGEVQLLTLVPGREMLWSLRRIWALPAFDVLDTPVTADRLKQGAEQVGRFALCRAGTASEVCPPAVLSAIEAAGDATAPIVLTP